MNLFNTKMTAVDADKVTTVERPKRGGWNKGLNSWWTGGRQASKTINGELAVLVRQKYGDTAEYHLKKYGHLNNIGVSAGAKKGNTNARQRIIQGKSVTQWAEKLNVGRRRVISWYEKHGTMKGCVPGHAGGWNKGIKLKAAK